MTDYNSPPRVGIPVQGNAPAPKGTISLLSKAVPSHNESIPNAGTCNQFDIALTRPKETQLSSVHQMSRQGMSQHPKTMTEAVPHPMGPHPAGKTNMGQQVLPPPAVGTTIITTTPPPGTLASPARTRSTSPGSSPLHPGAKSTNFHNIADLVGGSKTHYHQLPSATLSPERIPHCTSGCIKQQATPTSSPRLGDQSDEYIDVVDERPDRVGTTATSPYSSYSPDHATTGDDEGSTSPGRKANEPSPIHGENNRVRKGRTIYKAQQVYVLEEIFRRTHYPDPEVIETLSHDLDISENKIKVWFQNKRARWRRRAAETGHAVLPPIGYNPVASSSGLPGWPHAPPGARHVHTVNPAGTMLIPQPLYPRLPVSPHIPISQSQTPMSMLPQLQSLYSMDSSLMGLKTGLHNFPHVGINLPMMQCKV